MLGPQLALGTDYRAKLGAADSLEPRASQLFERVYTPLKRSGLGRLFNKTTQPVPVFSEVYGALHMTGQHYQGMHTVDVTRIVGTMDRDADFDVDFRPIQRHSELRWLKVATAMLRGVELPPIQLIQIGEDYYVKDGHHRVSVARALEFGYLDAEVIVYEFEDAA